MMLAVAPTRLAALTLFLVVALSCSDESEAPKYPVDLEDVGVPDLPIPDAAEIPTGARVEIMAPSSIVAGAHLPIVVRVLPGPSTDPAAISGWVPLHITGAEIDPTEILLRRGVGSTTLELNPSSDLQIDLEGFEGQASVSLLAEVETRVLSGSLVGADLTWGPNELIEVSADVTVAASEVLEIREGTRIRLASRANLFIDGNLLAHGTHESPIILEPHEPHAPWGGVVHRGVATWRNTIFIGGGGDDTRAFGHSSSQPLVHGESGSVITLDGCAIQDSPGKALGGVDTDLELLNSVIARTDTGGELEASHARIIKTWFFDFPNVGAAYVDDDNAAIYLKESKVADGVPQTTLIEDCTFIGGLDDGIDHNGATVKIRRSWVSDFVHEGIAASNGGSMQVVDTAISRCDQGLEAGYGAPVVSADHVLLFDNGVGARYGDSYDWDYDGTLDITNSVIVGNHRHQLWNFLHSTGAAKDGVMRVTYSLIETPGHDGEGNIEGTADLLGNDLRLVEEAAGIGAAEDGQDMGLITGQAQ